MQKKAKRIKGGSEWERAFRGDGEKNNSVIAPIFGYTSKIKLHKNTSNDQLLTNN